MQEDDTVVGDVALRDDGLAHTWRDARDREQSAHDDPSRDPASRDVVMVAVNRGNAPASAAVAAPEEWGSSAVVDLLDGTAVERAGGSLTLTVPAKGARILGR